MICAEIEEIICAYWLFVRIGCAYWLFVRIGPIICAYWLGNKVDTQTFRVSYVCGTVGLARSIGLRKIGQREKYLRLGKDILYTFL